MAMYVVVEFDNDAEAESLIATMRDGATVRVASAYKKPTKFCDCVDKSEKSRLGQKYNWYVCAVCLRPKEGVWQNPRNLLRLDERLSARQIMLNVREPRPT